MNDDLQLTWYHNEVFLARLRLWLLRPLDPISQIFQKEFERWWRPVVVETLVGLYWALHAHGNNEAIPFIDGRTVKRHSFSILRDLAYTSAMKKHPFRLSQALMSAHWSVFEENLKQALGDFYMDFAGQCQSTCLRRGGRPPAQIGNAYGNGSPPAGSWRSGYRPRARRARARPWDPAPAPPTAGRACRDASGS